MTRISLEDALHPNQQYVLNHAMSERMRAHTHPIATDTCYEKAALLGWSPERVIKALYYSDGESTIGIMVPEMGSRIHPGKVLSKAFSGLSRTKANRFVNGQTPLGMEYGTCTPFPRSDARVDGFIVHAAPALDDQLVDVSVGGVGSRWHQTSLHVPYGAIHDILQKRYAGNVVSLDVFNI